jgi:hypothetical protein
MQKQEKQRGILSSCRIAHNVKTITDNFLASFKSQAATGFEIDLKQESYYEDMDKEIILTTGFR